MDVPVLVEEAGQDEVDNATTGIEWKKLGLRRENLKER